MEQENRVLNQAWDLVNCAENLAASRIYNKSFELYIAAFETCPQIKSLLEPEFRLVLSNLNEYLASQDRNKDIFTNFELAVKLFPDNINILNDIGKYLYKFGYYSEAWNHFQKALKIDLGFVNAEKNLNAVKNLLVERWHFRMLNDKIRNEAYRKAIKETIKPNIDSVLDMGTGTGLLSLYANECSPTKKVAIDGSESMIKLAEKILKENIVKDVKLLNKMSFDVSVEEIGGRITMLVTELFDAGLFGEHILTALESAWKNLISVNGLVIPNKAEFFVIGVQSNNLLMKYQLRKETKGILKIPNLNVFVTTNESYDCEDVYLYKDLRYLTKPASLIKVDFNNISAIEHVIKSYKFSKQVELEIIENGEINALVGWFNLYLTDNITLTTDPRSENRANAWQQCIFYDFVPTVVAEDTTYKVQFTLNSNKLTLIPDHVGMMISHEALRFLNDDTLIKVISSCLSTVSVYLGQMAEMSQINVADLCPFPIFGLMMLTRGIQSLTCCARTENDKRFFQQVFLANNIPLSKITILVGNEWTHEAFGKEKYHAIFCNILELCGDIDKRLREIAFHLKHGHLMEGGLFFPSQISLMGQVVSSFWLDTNNRLNDENVNNYKISEFINVYQVSQNYHINLGTLEYKELTRPIELQVCSNNMKSDVINMPVIDDGEANAIICWYKVKLIDGITEISTNRQNSFIDGMAFLTNPKISMVRGDISNILLCVDPDNSFKLLLDIEAG